VLGLGAGLGVGAGFALTAGRRRRPNEQPLAADLGLGLKAGEPVALGLRRMALTQLDLAIELLERDHEHDSERAIHETRKALKRLRALVRLIRGELGEQAFARENSALREIASRLSGARDSAVLVATLEQLVAHHPKRLDAKGVRRLRTALVAERDRAEQRLSEHDGPRQQAIVELRAVRARALDWRLREGGFALVEPGLRRLYRAGRTRGRRARAEPSIKSLHDWRKRVKDLRYAGELLGAAPSSAAGGAKQRKHDRRVRKLTRRAKRLGELLGEEHDLALLAERIRAQRHCFDGDRAARKTLLKLIDRRRRKLREQALADGRRLYRRAPPRFTRRMRPPARRDS
jgi:CHAD domain